MNTKWIFTGLFFLIAVSAFGQRNRIKQLERAEGEGYTIHTNEFGFQTYALFDTLANSVDSATFSAPYIYLWAGGEKIDSTNLSGLGGLTAEDGLGFDLTITNDTIRFAYDFSELPAAAPLILSDTFLLKSGVDGSYKKTSLAIIGSTLVGAGLGVDNYVDEISFVDGDLILGRTGLLADLVQNLDGRWEPVFTKNTAFNKDFGTTAGTVAEGDDSRINNGQTAFTWGDHSTFGYLTSETDDQKIDTFSLISNILSLSLESDGEAAKTVDLSAYLDDQTVSITGAGINVVTGTYPNFTVTGTEVDGSVSNELQNLSWVDGTNTIEISNGTNAIITGFSETGHTHVEADITDLDHYSLAYLLLEDGAGSLLDADFLDGFSSAYYLDNANHVNTQGYISSQSDDQKIDVFTLVANTLSLSLENDGEATKTLDFSSYLDNTDNQTLTWVNATNTISISGGNSQVITGFSEDDHTHTFASLTAKPTTIAGYGITDFNSLWDTRLGTKTTTDLAEGTNLYYTEGRVSSNSSVVANTAKQTNVSTQLSLGTRTATTYGITSDGSADDIILLEATTSLSGLLSSTKFNNIVSNNAKITNATHTGDVTGATALTIAVDAVDIPMLSATGTASSTTFLRGDNTWGVPVNTNTDSQTLTWTPTTSTLAISGGNSQVINTFHYLGVASPTEGGLAALIESGNMDYRFTSTASSGSYSIFFNGDVNRGRIYTNSAGRGIALGTNSIDRLTINQTGTVTLNAYGTSDYLKTTGGTIQEGDWSTAGIVIGDIGGNAVDGTGAANQLAYWSDANTLTSSSSFTVAGSALLVSYGVKFTGADNDVLIYQNPGNDPLRFYDSSNGRLMLALHQNSVDLYADGVAKFKVQPLVAVAADRYGYAGTYSASEVQGIWSIGSAYKIDTALDDFGTLYGMGYAYDVNGGAPFAGNHQIVFTHAGTINAAIALTSGKAYFKGNAGIGTANPSTHRLHVDTNVNENIAVFSRDGSTTTVTDIITSSGRPQLRFKYAGATTWGVGNDAGKFVIDPDYILSGTTFVIDASGSVGIGTSAPDELLDVAGTAQADAFQTYDITTQKKVLYPEGGSYSNGASGNTGAIEIELPAANGSNMITMEVMVFDYVYHESFKLIISGYAYYSGATRLWTNTSAQIIASLPDRDFTVRFGRNTDNSRHTIHIGELTSTWDYLKVAITNVIISHGTPNVDWATDWNVGLEATSFETTLINTTTNFPIANSNISAWGLTNGYVPNYDSGLAKFENSPIFTDGTNVGIGLGSASQKLEVSGDVLASGFRTTTSPERIKYALWNDPNSYGMGFDDAYTYGGLTSYAVTFQNSNTAGRGFWWGDAAHTNAQGAMSLTTEGHLVVATNLSVGYGESVTSVGSYELDVSGDIRATDNVRIGSTGAYFYSDASNRIATPSEFYVTASSANTYLYSTNTYLGNTSGDVIRLRGNELNWDTGKLTTGGNLGVGTTSPAYKLDVSSGDGAVRIGANSSYGESLLLGGWGTSTASAWVRTSNGNLHMDAKLNSGMYLNFYHAGDIIIAGGGDVGIGTASILHKLHVEGDASIDEGLFLQRTNHAKSGISWYSSGYRAWATYMAPPGSGMGATGNITPVGGQLVTNWALRNYAESGTGYGWVWESGSANQVTPTIVAEIRSSDGSAWFDGNVTGEDGFTLNTGQSVKWGTGATKITGIDGSYLSFVPNNTEVLRVAPSGLLIEGGGAMKNLHMEGLTNFHDSRFELMPSSGTQIFANSEFWTNTAGWNIYCNGCSPSPHTLTRVTDATAPNSSGEVLRWTYTTGVSATSPGLGGFVPTVNVGNYEPGDVIMFRAIMKIPSGYNFGAASNGTGTEINTGFITGTAGTGAWKEYRWYRKVGETGTFSSTGHVYFSGADATITVDVALFEVIAINRNNGLSVVSDELFWRQDNVLTSLNLTNGYLPNYDLPTGLLEDSPIFTDGTNIGIGITNPSALLSLGSALGDKLAIYDNGSTKYGFGIQSSLLQMIAATSADLAFGHGSSASFTTSMFIDNSSGYVGIGTSTPSARLELYEQNTVSRIAPQDLLYLGSHHASVGYNGFGTAIVDFRRTYQNATPHAINRIAFIERGASGSDFGGAITFETKALSSGSVAPVERMRIDYTGNVGIGTSTPAQKIEISETTGGIMRLSRNDVTVVEEDLIGKVEFWSNDADASKVSGYVGVVARELYGRQGAMTFGVSTTNNVDAVEVMRINEDGHLSITNLNTTEFLYTNNDVITAGTWASVGTNSFSDDGQYIRANANDSFTGEITMGTRNALIASNYGHGVYGLYSATRWQHVWGMGQSYEMAADGTGLANFYGMAWTHSNNTDPQDKGLSHSLNIVHNGITATAIGTGIWTLGGITTTTLPSKEYLYTNANGTIAGSTWENALINQTDLVWTNLTNGYIPNYDSGLAELEDSPIFTDGTNVGIGTTTPKGDLHSFGNMYIGDVSGAVLPADGLFIEHASSADISLYKYGGSVSTIKSDGTRMNLGWATAVGGKSVNFINTGAGGISVGIGNTSPAQMLDVSGTVEAAAFKSRSGNNQQVLIPGGAEFVGSSSETGAIEITLPTVYANHMFVMTVEVYEYVASPNRSATYKIRGYFHAGGWANTGATVISANDDAIKTVRFGRSINGSTGIGKIYIGELADTWSYPQVTVTSYVSGYSGGATDYSDGWDITMEATSLDFVQATVSPSASKPVARNKATDWGLSDNNIPYYDAGTGELENSPMFWGSSTTPVYTNRYGYAGTYVSTQVQGIWSIGNGYAIDVGLDDFGSLYGMGYSYNANGGAPLASVHQIVFANAGTVNAAIGLDGMGYFNEIGINVANPAAKLDIDAGSSSSGIRIRGLTESSEIGDIYVASGGALVMGTVGGTAGTAYIDLRAEDNQYGIIIRESDGTGTAAFANLYVVDGGTDYMNIVMNNTSATTGLVITENEEVGIGTNNPTVALDVEGTIKAREGFQSTDGGEVKRIMFPKGGALEHRTTSVTGAIEIRLPIINADAMISMKVNVTENASGEGYTMQIHGHINSLEVWTNTSVQTISESVNNDRAVRFADSGGYGYIYIGELADTWTDIAVTITEVVISDGGDYQAWEDGWVMAFELSSFGVVQTTQENNIIAASGEWTPSITYSSGSPTIANQRGTYMIVGGYVNCTVHWYESALGASSYVIDIDVPVASAMTVKADATGVMLYEGTSTNYQARIEAWATTDDVRTTIATTSTGGYYTASFMYKMK